MLSYDSYNEAIGNWVAINPMINIIHGIKVTNQQPRLRKILVKEVNILLQKKPIPTSIPDINASNEKARLGSLHSTLQ